MTHDWEFTPHCRSQQEWKATDLGLSPMKFTPDFHQGTQAKKPVDMTILAFQCGLVAHADITCG